MQWSSSPNKKPAKSNKLLKNYKTNQANEQTSNMTFEMTKRVTYYHSLLNLMLLIVMNSFFEITQSNQ